MGINSGNKGIPHKTCDKAVRIVLYLNFDRRHWVSVTTGVTMTNWQVCLKSMIWKSLWALSVISHPTVSTSDEGEFVIAIFLNTGSVSRLNWYREGRERIWWFLFIFILLKQLTRKKDNLATKGDCKRDNGQDHYLSVHFFEDPMVLSLLTVGKC